MTGSQVRFMLIVSPVIDRDNPAPGLSLERKSGGAPRGTAQ
jgi:hypothetical protein